MKMIINREILSANIEKRIKTDLEEHKVSGASVIVKQNGKTVYKNCFGTTMPGGDKPVTFDTIFRLASMTKPITAVAIMILVDRKMLSLDDAVGKYLPEFKEMFICNIDEEGRIINTEKAKKEVIILHLLTHTSGIGSGDIGNMQSAKMTEKDRETLESTVHYFSKQGLAFEPFTKEAYSPFAAFDILVAIVEKITGEDYNDFIKRNIFIPCMMRDTTFVPSQEQWNRLITMHNRENKKSCIGYTTDNCVFEKFPCKHYVGGAGLISTIEDYSNFAEMLLNYGCFEGHRIISKESVNLISKPHFPKYIQLGTESWGLGVRVIVGDDNRLPVGSYGWSGAYGTHFWIDQVNKITAIYMKNSLYDGGAGAVTAYNFEKDVYEAL